MKLNEVLFFFSIFFGIFEVFVLRGFGFGIFFIVGGFKIILWLLSICVGKFVEYVILFNVYDNFKVRFCY